MFLLSFGVFCWSFSCWSLFGRSFSGLSGSFLSLLGFELSESLLSKFLSAGFIDFLMSARLLPIWNRP
ncbi:MAG: hypothetical protein II791_01545 [Bacteroidales bacterium]|nr:hypothetical protein [Bacteroidales bacterium]